MPDLFPRHTPVRDPPLPPTDRNGRVRTPKKVQTISVPDRVRGMDGLVVCAMASARRGRGFEPRFVCPSSGPLARPRHRPLQHPAPPPVPPVRPVACLLHFSHLLPYPSPPTHEKRGTRHSTPAAARSVTATAVRRAAHVLLVFLFRLPAEEESNSGLQRCTWLHSRCSTPPENLLWALHTLTQRWAALPLA